LTDEEFDGLEIESASMNVETYEAILAILDARESVSSTRDRLKLYFEASGLEIEASSPGRSNIYVGDEL
jgi:hypothetical protein